VTFSHLSRLNELELSRVFMDLEEARVSERREERAESVLVAFISWGI